MLYEVSRTLQQYLLTAIPVPGPDWVEIASPQDTGTTWPDGRLVLYLYAVSEDGHLRNIPQQLGPDGYRPAPLHLVLHYVVTYVDDDDAAEVQRRLTLVLQALHSRPRLAVVGRTPRTEITVRLRTVGSEELNQIWTAINHNLRLALFYDVSVAVVDSTAPERTAPVLEVGDPEVVPA
jgi:hypothetical protein